MPPRKSDASIATISMDDNVLSQQPKDISFTPVQDSTTPPEAPQNASTDKASSKAPPSASKDPKEPKDGIAIEDLSLPRSIVTRLAKGALPPNTQIQANAILAMQKGSTVFISYLAGLANEIATQAGRKTISPQDVLKAVEEAELPESWKAELEGELNKFNENQAEKRGAYRKKVAEGKKDKGADASLVSASGESKDADSEKPRATKKARMEEGVDTTMGEDDETMVDETIGDDQEQDHEDDEVEEDEDEAEDNEGDDGEEDPLDVEAEDKEDEKDEALDNGEDSD